MGSSIPQRPGNREIEMATTYTVGTLGRGGRVIGRASGQLFEATENGEYTNKREAFREAAHLAAVWARDSEDGACAVAVTRYSEGDPYPDLMAVATASVGRKRVVWSDR